MNDLFTNSDFPSYESPFDLDKSPFLFDQQLLKEIKLLSSPTFDNHYSAHMRVYFVNSRKQYEDVYSFFKKTKNVLAIYLSIDEDKLKDIKSGNYKYFPDSGAQFKYVKKIYGVSLGSKQCV